MDADTVRDAKFICRKLCKQGWKIGEFGVDVGCPGLGELPTELFDVFSVLPD